MIIESLYVLVTCMLIPSILYTFVIRKSSLYYVYWVVTSCFCITSMWVFIETVGSMMKTNKRLLVSDCQKKKKVLLIIPVYLDNEYAILEDTLEAFIKLKSKRHIKVMLVYNTSDINKTGLHVTNLMEKWHNKTVSNVHIEVQRNNEGKSKADNINYVLNDITNNEFDYIGIYDADHHPEEDSVEIAVNMLESLGCDIVQGQCAIRNVSDSFLTRIVSIEFVEMYNVGHDGRSKIFGLGLFGGSNGLWKAQLLHRIKMDNTMLTEDIDSTFRSIASGAKIVYSKDVVSYELAPVFVRVWLKQRMRWSQGWFEVSIKHFRKCVSTKGLSILQRVAIVMLLMWREVFVYFTFHPILLLVGYYIQNGKLEMPSPLQITVPVVLCMLGFLKIILVYFKTNGKNRLGWVWYITYAMVSPLYILVLACIQVATHIRHLMRRNEWVTTSR